MLLFFNEIELVTSSEAKQAPHLIQVFAYSGILKVFIEVEAEDLGGGGVGGCCTHTFLSLLSSALQSGGYSRHTDSFSTNHVRGHDSVNTV